VIKSIRSAGLRALATVAAVPLALVLAGPSANAASYDYWHCSGGFGTAPSFCTNWTGGYPSGYVRASSESLYYYSIRLDQTTTLGSGWRTVASATNHARRTAGVRVGRDSWYRACIRNTATGPWSCQTNINAQYLGD
jgi:hypothetical protein